MGSELRAVNILYQAQILIWTTGYHPRHRLYTEFGMLRSSGINDLTNHLDSHIPQFTTEILAITAIPSGTIRCTHYIHATGSTNGICHAELADGIVNPFLTLVGIGSQCITPNTHFCDSQSSLVGSLLIGHIHILPIITSDGKIHSLKP